jgi:FKBP-type peptidyl-prolyl cis-trans isomerase (trigger factor)
MAEIKKLEHSEVEIIGSIPADVFDKTRSKAIENIGKDVELQGFRKGHVPEKALVAHIGEHAILEEMAEITIAKEYKNIIIENKLDPIGRPEVSITKMAMGNPLEFKLKVTVMPEIVLGDYKKIAKKICENKEKVAVTQEEVDTTIGEIQKMRARSMQPHHHHEEGEEHDHEHEHKDEELEIPQLTDEYVKELGDFADVADFKTKLEANILLEKEKGAEDKRRVTMIEEIIKDSKIDVPKIIIESEQNKTLAEFKSDLERVGMSFEDYIKNAKKTEEEIWKDFGKNAEQKAKFQLILNQIAKDEKIVADEKLVAEQCESIQKQYPHANKDHVRVFVESNLINQKVIQFLEESK